MMDEEPAYPFFGHYDTKVTQGDLPHWSQEGKITFVTYRLADSIPLHAQKVYKESIQAWRAKHKPALTIAEEQELERLKLTLMEQLLSKCLGSCLLRKPKVRQVVSESLHHFDHQHYHLHDYVIMPNHVHVLAESIGEHTMQQIVSAWKSYTAHRLNALLEKTGEVWQRESFDRIMRSPRNYWHVVDYIAQNPKNLHEGEFSLYLTDGRPHFNRVQPTRRL